jgi:hypothetical protein
MVLKMGSDKITAEKQDESHSDSANSLPVADAMKGSGQLLLCY